MSCYAIPSHPIYLSFLLIGEHISIDYANLFYHPRRVRIAHSRKVYNFDCACELCAIPPSPGLCIDHFRVFECPHCLTGKVCAGYSQSAYTVEEQGIVTLPNSDADEFVGFLCLSCHWKADARYCASFLSLEDRVCDGYSDYQEEREQREAPPSKKRRKKELNTRMHTDHYLLFSMDDEKATDFAEAANECLDHSESLGHLTKAITLIERLLERLNRNPGVCPLLRDKMIYLERKGQLLIAAGDALQHVGGSVLERAAYLEEARSTFAQAYSMSVVLTGERSKETAQLKLLSDENRMPTSAYDMRKVYNN